MSDRFERRQVRLMLPGDSTGELTLLKLCPKGLENELDLFTAAVGYFFDQSYKHQSPSPYVERNQSRQLMMQNLACG